MLSFLCFVFVVSSDVSVCLHCLAFSLILHLIRRNSGNVHLIMLAGAFETATHFYTGVDCMIWKNFHLSV